MKSRLLSLPRLSDSTLLGLLALGSHTGLFVCRGPRRPWAEMWQTMQWFQ